MRLHELQEKRALIIVDMRALADLAANDKRDLTAEEAAKFDGWKAEVARLDADIQRRQFLDEAERAAPAIILGNGRDGHFEERAREFSIIKVLRAQLPTNLGGGGDIGFEREISQEVQRRSGREFQGVAVPDQVFYEQRTLLAGSSAADLIPNTHRPDLFIDRLRARLVVARLGGTYLDNLVGSPIDIPKQTGSSTAQWVAEDGSLTETDATFSDVNLSPKTVGAMTSYSRRTLLNSSPAIEDIIRADLAAVIASAIDAKALTGDGTSNTPTGITNTSGVAELAITTVPTWAEVLQFIAAIDAGNALSGTLGWVTSPWIVAALRAAPKHADGFVDGAVQDEPNSLAGYPLVTTTAIPGVAPTVTPEVNSALIYGDWSQLVVASWTGVDILANPFEATAYAKGRVIVRAMKDVDIAIRHPAAFAFSDTIVTGTDE